MKANQSIRDCAAQIVEEASAIALDYFRADSTPDVSFKADGSPVSRADRAVESEIRRLLGERFPGEAVFGEEFGAQGEGACVGSDSSPTQSSFWLVDPIDGTRSFISGDPLFGTMLARVDEEGEAIISAISMPALGEVFSAARGGGAMKNAKPIRVSRRLEMEGANLWVNESELLLRERPEVLSRLRRANPSLRFAHDCHSYLLLASGRIDALVEFELQPYDYLPVALLVEEAGGSITDWSGNPLRSGPLDSMRRDVNVAAAATPRLHERLLELLS